MRAVGGEGLLTNVLLSVKNHFKYELSKYRLCILLKRKNMQNRTVYFC